MSTITSKIAVISPHLLPIINGVSVTTDRFIEAIEPALIIGPEISKLKYKNLFPVDVQSGGHLTKAQTKEIVDKIVADGITHCIIVCWLDWPMFYLLPILKKLDMKIYLYSHGISVNSQIPSQNNLKRLVKKTLFNLYEYPKSRYLDGIIQISKSKIPIFDELKYIKPQKLKYFLQNPPSLDASKLYQKAKVMYDFLYCANYTKIKRHDRILALARACPNKRFCAIGSTDTNIYQELLSQKLPNLDLFIDDQTGIKEKLYLQSKAKLILSDWEASPLTAIDAIALGMPVISVDVGELRSLDGVQVFDTFSSLKKYVQCNVLTNSTNDKVARLLSYQLAYTRSAIRFKEIINAK